MLLGPWEVMAILAIALLLFGPKKLPELARSLGSAVSEYRKAASGNTEEKTTKQEPEEDKLIYETAEKLGIGTKGKSKSEILKEILEKSKSEDKAVLVKP